MVRTAPQQRDVVYEIDSCVVRPVVAARPKVVSPSQVWIGHIRQIASTVSTSRWVNRARQCVIRAQCQVPQVKCQVNLKTVIVRIGLIGRHTDRLVATIRQTRSGVVPSASDETGKIALTR